MSYTKKNISIVLFFTIFVGIFWFIYRSKDFDHKGFKRFIISIKIALVMALSLLSPAHAKDGGFLPGTEGFTPPISRPAPNNHRYFSSKTGTGNSGAPKKGPSSSSSSNSKFTPKPKIAHQIKTESYISTPKKKKKKSVKINMDAEYTKFQESMHPNTKCSRERFEDLCKNPETGRINEKSIEEAKTALQAEAEEIVYNVARPSKNSDKNMRSDFVVSGPIRT